MSEKHKECNVTIYFGINGAFITRRWEEPENWMRLTRETGYTYHEFCADVLDPFFSGDKEYQIETAHAIREAAQKYGVTITDYYTGVATHRFHGLSHSDPRVRERMKQWIVEAMDIVLAMGTDRIGGHWDAFSVEVHGDTERTQKAFENIYEQFRQLARIGKEKGIAAIYNEQMYIPSEIPWTLQQAQEFLIAVNKDNSGCPVRLTIDTGHQAGMHYGLSGPDLDYIEWIRRFGAIAEVIHIQQTTPDASHHWAFTKEYNEKGHVRIEAILEALQYAHEHYHEQPYAPYLARVERTYLIAEIIPGST
ncbi:MAG TPA: sugar phosphate isomerase/epimerase, partial [Armatimonadetes bacterium]|nr:sugar phosphate isomerase/epimerase [Armatimonadota bacterium]